MADSSFRSRHAGLPGSMMAIRVNYTRGGNAFDAPGTDTAVGKRREEVRRWAQGHRLGDRHQWSSCTRDEKEMCFPRRPLMHTLSEFQGVKLEYNYRSQTLPAVNKDAVYIPKPNKLQVDRTLLLSAEEKARLVPTCLGTSTRLSRAEMQNEMPTAAREQGWDVSTELPEERASVFKHPRYDDLRALNKTKGILNPNTYVSPIARQQLISQAKRSEKLCTRGSGAHAATWTKAAEGDATPLGGSGAACERVFKMSNVGDWWGECPIAEVRDSMVRSGVMPTPGAAIAGTPRRLSNNGPEPQAASTGGSADGGGSGIGGGSASPSRRKRGGGGGGGLPSTSATFDASQDPR